MSKTGPARDSLRSDAEAKRKVYKNVLNTPYTIRWPTIPNDLSQTILTNLLNVLEPIGQYRRAIKEQKRNKNKQDNNNTTTTAAAAAAAAVIASPLSEPDLKSRLIIGLNDVTRHLEKEIHDRASKAESAIPDNNNTTSALFVCRRDLQPPHLCNHLATMACLAKVKLVNLPKDSSMKLASALELQRVACVLVQIVPDKEERLRLDLDEVPFVDAPWLSPGPGMVYQPTQIKILETTATIKPKKRQTPSSNVSDSPAGKKAKTKGQ